MSRTRAESFHSGHRNPVVVIPGVFESWQFMLPVIKVLHRAGHPVYVVPVLQRNRSDVRSSASIVADHLATEESVNHRITPLYGLFDPHSPEGSILPGATNIQLPAAGHVRILGNRETLATVLKLVEAASPRGVMISHLNGRGGAATLPG